MITKNFKMYQNWLQGSNYSYYVINKEGTRVRLDRSGYDAVLGNFGALMCKGKCDEFSTREGGVYFGAGSAPETEDDYTLDLPIFSGLTITNPVNFVPISTRSNGDNIFQVSYIVTNSRETPITIQELGCFNHSGTTSLILFDRKVFDEPITLQPGETTTITYRIVDRTYQEVYQ